MIIIIVEASGNGLLLLDNGERNDQLKAINNHMNQTISMNHELLNEPLNYDGCIIWKNDEASIQYKQYIPKLEPIVNIATSIGYFSWQA